MRMTCRAAPKVPKMEKETWPRGASCGAGGTLWEQARQKGLLAVPFPPPPRYLDTPRHRGVIQQQLQDVEADDEHRDPLGREGGGGEGGQGVCGALRHTRGQGQGGDPARDTYCQRQEAQHGQGVAQVPLPG